MKQKDKAGITLWCGPAPMQKDSWPEMPQKASVKLKNTILGHPDGSTTSAALHFCCLTAHLYEEL